MSEYTGMPRTVLEEAIATLYDACCRAEKAYLAASNNKERKVAMEAIKAASNAYNRAVYARRKACQN